MTDTTTMEMLLQLAGDVTDGWNRRTERPKNALQIKRQINALHDFVVAYRGAQERRMQAEEAQRAVNAGAKMAEKAGPTRGKLAIEE